MRTRDVLRPWLIGLIGIVALAVPADGEVRIHIFDKTTPVVSDQIFEEEAWVLYQEGDSGYLFSVPRERVEKLEIVQDGTVRTLPITSQDGRFRDFRRQVFMAVLEVEDKRVDAVFKRLQDELRNMGTAASAATAGSQPRGPGAAPAPATFSREAEFALALQQERVARLLEEATAVGRRMDRILQRAGKYEISGGKPRYYFYR